MSKNLEEKLLYINIAFKLIEKSGWNSFTLEDLSNDKKVSKEKLYTFFSTEIKLLESFTEMIDEEVINDLNLEEFEHNSVKDNLFELIMTRFDKLLPYKKSLKRILSDIRYKPLVLKSLSKKILNTLDLFLEISNAKNNYFFDLFKINIILLIYSYSFKIWLEDNSADMGKTMSELDNWLSEAEKFAKKTNAFF